MIRAEEITSVLLQELEAIEKVVEMTDIGYVIEVGDGVARAYGLQGAMASELLYFPQASERLGREFYGIALNLEMDSVGIVLLGPDQFVREGDEVRCTGRVVEVPVGKELLGRVINPVGQPLDGKGPITAKEFRRIEVKAPGVVKRQPVKEPLMTGLKAIDSMIPIGRGQRELILGDRQTGKTAIIVDTIINQKRFHEAGDPVYCIYVAISDVHLIHFTADEPLHDVLGNGFKLGERRRHRKLRAIASDLVTPSGKKVTALAPDAIKDERRCAVLAHEDLSGADDVVVVGAAKPFVTRDDNQATPLDGTNLQKRMFNGWQVRCEGFNEPTHLFGVRFARRHSVLDAAQPRRRHHLHRRHDFLQVAHRPNFPADCPQTLDCHRPSLRLLLRFLPKGTLNDMDANPVIFLVKDLRCSLMQTVANFLNHLICHHNFNPRIKFLVAGNFHPNFRLRAQILCQRHNFGDKTLQASS